jgi:hypothetical protein
MSVSCLCLYCCRTVTEHAGLANALLLAAHVVGVSVVKCRAAAAPAPVAPGAGDVRGLATPSVASGRPRRSRRGAPPIASEQGGVSGRPAALPPHVMPPTAPAAALPGASRLAVPGFSLASLPIVTAQLGAAAGGASYFTQVAGPAQHTQHAGQAVQHEELQLQFGRLGRLQQLNVLTAVQHFAALQQAYPPGTHFLLMPGQEAMVAERVAPPPGARPVAALQHLQQQAAIAAAAAPVQVAEGLWQVAGLPHMVEEPGGVTLLVPGPGTAGGAAARGYAAQQQPYASPALLPIQAPGQPAEPAAIHGWLPFAAAPQQYLQASGAQAADAGYAHGGQGAADGDAGAGSDGEGVAGSEQAGAAFAGHPLLGF